MSEMSLKEYLNGDLRGLLCRSRILRARSIMVIILATLCSIRSFLYSGNKYNIIVSKDDHFK